MNNRLQRSLKNIPLLPYMVVVLSMFFLVFVISKIFMSPEFSERKSFVIFFIMGFGLGLVVLIKLIKMNFSAKKQEIKSDDLSAVPKTHQQLVDEIENCLAMLKQYKYWTIGCLLVAWIIIYIGKQSGYAPYNESIFTFPVFILAFLAGTKNLEKEHKIDMKIVGCALQGMELEKKYLNSRTIYFQDFIKSYEGFGMFWFALVRISPALWIAFCFFNTGFSNILSDRLAPWIIHMGFGVGLGLIGIFLGRIACHPYIQLLQKIKEDQII